MADVARVRQLAKPLAAFDLLEWRMVATVVDGSAMFGPAVVTPGLPYAATRLVKTVVMALVESPSLPILLTPKTIVTGETQMGRPRVPDAAVYPVNPLVFTLLLPNVWLELVNRMVLVTNVLCFVFELVGPQPMAMFGPPARHLVTYIPRVSFTDAVFRLVSAFESVALLVAAAVVGPFLPVV